MKVIILGAGLTGLSTCYELEKKKADYLVLEKETKVGGLCRSENLKGFVFDYSGHFFHFSDSEIEKFVKKILKDNILKVKRNSKIYTTYSRKMLIPFPFQANIKFLSEKFKFKCIKELLNAYLKNSKIKDNFYDWLINNFGKTITDLFFLPYNSKLWLIDLRKVSTSWVQQFVPVPKIEDIILNFFYPKNKEYGYNIFFYYPKYNGIQSFIDALSSYIDKSKIITEVKLVKIDYLKKEIYFLKNNKMEKVKYDKLISTIPIFELLKISNIPNRIRLLYKGLKYSGVLCYNIATKKLNFNKIHWIYYPDKNIIFYRLGFYSNVSKNLIPSKEYDSLYVEVSTKANEDYNELEIYKRVVDDLIKVKILNSAEQIIFYKLLKIPVAYVIYDHYRDINLPLIHSFLNKNNIYSIGRYGEWKYSYMSENIKDGILTAKKVLLNG